MANEKRSLATSTDKTTAGIGTSPDRTVEGIGTSPGPKPGIGTTPGGTLEGIGTSPDQKPGIGTTPVNDGQAQADAMHDRNKARAFKCEINGQVVPLVSFSHTLTDPKGSVESYSGGDITGEKAEASSGASQHNESTMGHNYVTELTLVTFVTPDDNTFSDAANAVANQGKNERYTITITEMAKDKSVIKTFVYDNSLLTRMDFPAVDAAGGGMLKRNSSWKPEILTVS